MANEFINDSRPVAIINQVKGENTYIAELDPVSRMNVEQAVRYVEILNGYTDDELEERVESVMADQIWVLTDDIEIIEVEHGAELSFPSKTYKELQKEGYFKAMQSEKNSELELE